MRGVISRLALATALIIGAAVPTSFLSGALTSASALAQQALVAPGGPSQRDCQTVRTCNFARNGGVRGCLSSFTCRTCKVVRARCAIGQTRANCQEFVCSWGG